MATTPESSTCGDSLDSGTSAHHCPLQPDNDDDDVAVVAMVQVGEMQSHGTEALMNVTHKSATNVIELIKTSSETDRQTKANVEDTVNVKVKIEQNNKRQISDEFTEHINDTVATVQLKQQPQPQQQQSQQTIFPPLDEIPEPIKVLDDIISEFEDLATSKPALLTMANNGENHSEDDGYMSLSRKNLPKKDDGEVLSQHSAEDTTPTPLPSLILPSPTSPPPPAPTPASVDEQPHSEMHTAIESKYEHDNANANANANADVVDDDDVHVHVVDGRQQKLQSKSDATATAAVAAAAAPIKVAPTEAEIVQSTLPKVRPTMAATVGSKNYSSLPCCGGGRSSALAGGSTSGGGSRGAIDGFRTRHGSCNGERNALGIDISAVHNAVLRGGLAKLPEPIVNEHPVTIYPGPSSSGRRSQQRTNSAATSKSSVEKHKEMCHILKPLTSSTSASTSTSTSTSNSSSASSSSNNTNNRKTGRESERLKDNSNRFGSAQQRKPHAVAWEIHFDSKSTKHTKSYTTSKLPTKRMMNEKPPQSHQRDCPAIGAGPATGTGAGDELYGVPAADQVDGPDLPNCCMYRNADMLGKGTFIIRRNHAKKPPPAYASEIFQQQAPAADELLADCGRSANDAAALEQCNSYELLPGAMNNLRQISPSRDKLLLDIEPLQPLPQSQPDYGLLAHTDSLSGFDSDGDMGGGVGSKLYTRAASGELSCDSFNEEHSTSLEEEELEDETEESSDNMNKLLDLSGYDDYHGYQAAASVNAAINGALKAQQPLPLPQPPPPPQQQEYAEMRTSNTTTPHTDLAPTLEEDEEQYSDFSYGGGNGTGGVGVNSARHMPAPLKQIESNISALLRGDIAVARVGEQPQLPLPQGTPSQPPLPLPLPLPMQMPMPMPMPMPLAQAPVSSLQGAHKFRPGIVHKSESAKEMLLSQNSFGPLPPSPPSSPDAFDYEAHMPPLPPSPTNMLAAAMGSAPLVVEIIKPPQFAAKTTPTVNASASAITTTTASVEVHHHGSQPKTQQQPQPQQQQQQQPPLPALPLPLPPLPRTEERRSRERHAPRHLNDELPLPLHAFDLPPAVPPHRTSHSMNTIKSRSIDSNYKRRKSPKMLSGYGTGNCNGSTTTPTGIQPPLLPPMNYDGSGGGGTVGGGGGTGGVGAYSSKRYISYGTKQRSLKQSPREEQRLQTSCSLPETPIFARGCDIPRTPFRRQNEISNSSSSAAVNGSRTAPRSSTSHNINMGNSIVGIAAGGGTFSSASMCRQRSINHALASNEMLRLSGAPARGWYPKQRTMRPASTENIDRLATARVWDSAAGMSGTGQRKPLTLPPNLTPSFLNKSPREALRRVTSLLITKKKNTKERRNKPYNEHAVTAAAGGDASYHNYDEVNTINVKNDGTRSSKHGGTSTSHSNTTTGNSSTQKSKEKKKGIFKSLWKRTKHVSIEQ